MLRYVEATLDCRACAKWQTRDTHPIDEYTASRFTVRVRGGERKSERNARRRDVDERWRAARARYEIRYASGVCRCEAVAAGKSETAAASSAVAARRYRAAALREVGAVWRDALLALCHTRAERATTQACAMSVPLCATGRPQCCCAMAYARCRRCRAQYRFIDNPRHWLIDTVARHVDVATPRLRACLLPYATPAA